MDKLRWVFVLVVVLVAVVAAVGLGLIFMPGSTLQTADAGSDYSGAVSAGALLRVPVTGIYPGGSPAGLHPDMPDPLANDPDAVQRGMRDFDAFNCSGCHAANAGGGMGPSLSDDAWIYRSSPANIYLTIAQGRQAGMPAFGAMLPDRTIWELVAYIKSISEKPGPAFGKTTSAAPQSPSTEQVPQGRAMTATPWQATEPLPPNGQKPGTN